MFNFSNNGKSSSSIKTSNDFLSKAGVPKASGSAIKSNITKVLSNKYGQLDTKHLFDGIDDNEIEKNIQTAENTIKTNIDNGLLTKDYSAKLPNLRDGLALSYAAADAGNSKATTKAERRHMLDENFMSRYRTMLRINFPTLLMNISTKINV